MNIPSSYLLSLSDDDASAIQSQIDADPSFDLFNE